MLFIFRSTEKTHNPVFNQIPVQNIPNKGQSSHLCNVCIINLDELPSREVEDKQQEGCIIDCNRVLQEARIKHHQRE